MGGQAKVYMQQRRFAIFIAVVAALLVALLALARVGTQETIILLERSRDSVAAIITEGVFATGLLVTAVSFRRGLEADGIEQDHLERLGGLLVWIIRMAVAVTTALLWTAVSVIVFSVIALVLRDATLPRLLVVALAGGVAGLLGFYAAYTAARMNTRRLLTLAAAVMVIGLLLAVAFTGSLDWWTQAVSFLGVERTGVIFNLTFILAGLLLLAVMQDKLGDLDVLRRRGLFRAPRLVYMPQAVNWMCLSVVGVGLLPYQGYTQVPHQVAASGALVLFVYVAIFTPRLVPIFPSRFNAVSLALGIVALVVIAAHYIASAISFSLMELLLLTLAGAWISTFYVFTHDYVSRTDLTLITGQRPVA